MELEINPKLSIENFNKIIATGLYAYGDNIKMFLNCKNDTYKPAIRGNQIFMLDSYWTNDWESKIEVTDKNIDNWKLLLDYEKYIKAHGSRCKEYNREDWIKVADDSGGWSYPKHYLKKYTKPYKMYQLKILESEKLSLEIHLDQVLKKIETIKNELKGG